MARKKQLLDLGTIEPELMKRAEDSVRSKNTVQQETFVEEPVGVSQSTVAQQVVQQPISSSQTVVQQQVPVQPVAQPQASQMQSQMPVQQAVPVQTIVQPQTMTSGAMPVTSQVVTPYRQEVRVVRPGRPKLEEPSSIIPRRNGRTLYLEPRHNDALATISHRNAVDKQDVIRTALDMFLVKYMDGERLNDEGERLVLEYFRRTHRH